MFAIEPPAEYLPYDGSLVVLERAPMQVRAICRALGIVAFAVLGCQVWGAGGCLIVVPTNDDGSVRRHEEAHCNGWRH